MLFVIIQGSVELFHYLPLFSLQFDYKKSLHQLSVPQFAGFASKQLFYSLGLQRPIVLRWFHLRFSIKVRLHFLGNLQSVGNFQKSSGVLFVGLHVPFHRFVSARNKSALEDNSLNLPISKLLLILQLLAVQKHKKESHSLLYFLKALHLAPVARTQKVVRFQ